jgi:glyoxylase-like metal-dependent hydrolase (beta-lactamase superfamily II)/rhodanese-related sulfurtransferase
MLKADHPVVGDERMSMPDLPELDVTVPAIDPETLKERVESGDDVLLLDTRVPDKHEEWKIDAPNVEHVNRPYFQYLDEEIDESLLEGLPEDDEFVVLCSKGHSSEYVAGKLVEEGYDALALERGMEGWAGVYDYVEFETSSDATIAQYQRPSSGCLAYLVVSGDEAAVVDPLRAFTDEYRADAKALGADVQYVLDTHVHADHVSGLRKLASETGAQTVMSQPALDRGVTYDVDHAVTHGDTISVGDVELEVVHTPGHTSGMTSYRVDDVLFTGDGLFTESVARPDLEDGDEGARDAASLLYETLQERVLSHPPETIVAPAHFSDAATSDADGAYVDTLGSLSSSMDPLHYERTEFVDFILADMPPRPANYEDIIATNLGRRDVDDDEAFTLELGPNNCAASGEAMTSD